MKLNQIYIFTFVVILSAMSAKAQQRPQFSQYMINNFLFNPGTTGAYDYIDTRLGFRNQWSGFEGSPRTVFLTGHGRLGNGQARAKGPLPTIGTIDYGNLKRRNRKNKDEEAYRNKNTLRHGVGGLLLYDETGSITRWMVYGSYALHVPIKDNLYISLGAHLGILRHGLDGDELVSDPFNPGVSDPALQGNLSSIVPDLALGAMVYKMSPEGGMPGYYVGFAVNQLLQSNLSFSDVEKNKLPLHYFITAGYSYPLSNKIDLIPSVALKFLQGAPISYQFNARGAFQLSDKSNLWIGAGISNEGTFPFLFGLGISKFLDLNFSYDLVTSNLKNFTNTILPADISSTQTYEISLGLRFRDNRKVIRHNLF